ncbi:MAG: glycoside hydrolase family 88 protein, partial [Paludibacteraceae bacterium]|nr:glycoside hydrolase family 88 protein [Paludibacteraceae bacterium]
KYDATGTLVKEAESTRGFDYVPGLVAKAVLEAVDYYKDEEFAKPWFYSIQDYGNEYYDGTGNYRYFKDKDEKDDGVPNSGGSLDDLNACKLYFTLADLTKPGAVFENATTYSHCATAKTRTLEALEDHNENQSISTTKGTYKITKAATLPLPGGGTYDVTGGWFHKSNYYNQLWLDGQYMGPALLAQLVAEGKYISGSAEGDWNIIMKQFDITWTYLWNEEDKLLYHAFCADGGDNTTSRSSDWEGLSTTEGKECYHSADYWGRAVGWYVLALVDVLEQMDKAGMSKSDARYQRLLTYLQKSADGLLARQDATSGCWYQLLQYDKTFCVEEYVAKNGETIKSGNKCNYLEASASAIFTAFYLKAMRLGYLDKTTYEAPAKKAYKGLVETFLKENVGDNNDYDLIQSCKSAGLGGSSNTGEKRRTGSAAYYLLGTDVGVTTNYTEGKILGAFVLAAVEYERAYYRVPELSDNNCRCLSVSFH